MKLSLLLCYQMEIDFCNESTNLQNKDISSDVITVVKETCNRKVDCSTNVMYPPTSLFKSPVKSNRLLSVGIGLCSSQPSILVTEKMDDNGLDENSSLNNNVEKNVTLHNKNEITNVEIDSKEIPNSNDNITKNEDSKENYMEIDLIVEGNELNQNANNKVENSKVVKDDSRQTLKDNISESDMIVERNDDKNNDNSTISKPKG